MARTLITPRWRRRYAATRSCWCSTTNTDRLDEFRQHWGLVLASHLGLMLGVATMAFAYTIGVFTRPPMQEFGWSDGQILAALLFVTVPTLVMAVVAGWFADRHGVRRVVLTSQFAFGLSFIAIGLSMAGTGLCSLLVQP